MQVRVDRRVELFSILFHLAGNDEYRAFDTPYRRAVDAWFGPFHDHPAVGKTRELHGARGIGYNAPISLAVFLGDDLGIPAELLARPDELDPRWRGVAISAYVDAVRTFSTDARAAAFFDSQRPYFESVEHALDRALSGVDIEAWFAAMLGPRPGATFVIVPGLLTGPWSYDASTRDACGGRAWMYQVIELEQADPSGLPQPSRTTLELVAHEMAHAYVNPVIEQHADALAVAEPLYVKHAAAMQQQHYPSSRIMVEESLVRAIAALFARDRWGNAAASELVSADVARGFTWNIELAKWIDGYPKRPLALEAMVPELARWFGAAAEASS